MEQWKMRDNRNSETIGNMLASLKKAHPNLTAAERADMIEEVYSIYSVVNSNGSGVSDNGKHSA